jgi:hypothetical protein
MKIRIVAAELFHADGWTDRHDEANNLFSHFANWTIKARLGDAFKHLKYEISIN